ncbi:hypothetical protein Tco_0756905 [Tanacetum coccineum]
MNRDSHVKNSVLANSKKPAKKVAVYVRKNKQTDNTSENVISNKENVIDVDVANASKAKTLLCVSFSKPKIDVGSTSKDNDKVSRTKKRNLRDKSLSTYMKNKIQTSRIWQKWFELKPDVVWSPVNTKPNVVHRSFYAFVDSAPLPGNDNFAAITGYGDYIQGNITICHVYYVEGLGHNLFSVGQFCDGDLEVDFCSKTCYVCNLEGDDLLTGGRESKLYTISISDMAASSPVCLMSKATLKKSWLWHRKLSHLNFGTGNGYLRKGQERSQNGQNRARNGKEHDEPKSKVNQKRCGEPLYGHPCRWCTYERCGNDLRDGYCFLCHSRNVNSFTYDSTPNSFDNPPDFSYPPPQPQYVSYSCELCGNDAHHGYDCPPQVPFVYNQDPCFNQNFDYFPQTSPSFPQQYPCCEDCRGPHETFQGQTMNYYEPNPCYDSNYSGFDQFEPPQFPVIRQLIREKTCVELLAEERAANINTQYSVVHQPPQEVISLEFLQDQRNLINFVQTFLRKFNRFSFYETPKVISLAWETILEIEHAFEDKQYQPKDDSFSINDIDYVEASPLDFELVSLEEVKDFNKENRKIKDDILCEKLSKINLLIAKIEAINSNPPPSFDFVINTNLLILIADFSQYDSFIFDLSIDPFPPADKSDFYHEEFTDELAHIISLLDLECFYFKNEPDLRDLINPGIRENVSSTTNVNLPFEDA